MNKWWNDICNIFRKVKYKEKIVCFHPFPPYEFNFFKKLLEINSHKGVTKEWLGGVCHTSVLNTILTQDFYLFNSADEIRRKSVWNLTKVLVDKYCLEELLNDKGDIGYDKYTDIDKYVTALVFHNLPDSIVTLIRSGRYTMSDVGNLNNFNARFLSNIDVPDCSIHKIVYSYTNYHNCYKFKVWYTKQDTEFIKQLLK